MVNVLEIRHLPDNEEVQVALLQDGSRRTASPISFQNPLAESDYQEIDWYLAEYLDNPLGEAQARAEAVETGLRNLGRLLFESVFKGNEEAIRILADARELGLDQFLLKVISDRAEFLALPWEVMNDPEIGYPTVQMSAILRRTTEAPAPEDQQPETQQQFNVLLISPMPESPSRGGEANSASRAGQQGVECLKVLESLNIQVELDYLRPPTWEALESVLLERKGYYHLLQFDGITLQSEEAAAGEPALLFEDAAHQSHAVPAARVAEQVVNAGIPIVLVAAAGATDSGSASVTSAEVASVFAQKGVSQTAVLPYPLHTAEVKEQFLAQAYQGIIQGQDLGRALASARRTLMDKPHRLTISGQKLFWDWMPPQVFEGVPYTPPVFEEDKPDPLAPPVIGPAEDEDTGTPLPAAGQYGLVGRRAETRQIERMLEASPVVLLAGDTGVGKTEFALGLCNWIQKTTRAQFPGGVFYTSFEASHPAGLERIIHEIGTAVAGLNFADMNARRQRQWVLEYLQSGASLLVWDNLQNIAGNLEQPDSGLLNAEEQAELNDFLSQITQGENGSRVLLVSQRASEAWLTAPHKQQTLSGLQGHDLLELASKIIQKAGIDSNRITPDVYEVLNLLEGHPLAMQIALPLIKEVPGSVLLAEIRRNMEQLADNPQEPGRPPYLSAVLEYAWSKMPHRNRTHLPMLALFQRRVMMDILTHITQERAYRGAMGEELGWGACRTMLRSALASGFLEPISPSVYQIHPALPSFFGQKLSRQLSGSAIRQLELEFLRVYTDTADFFMESLYENQNSGVTAILAEEGNLTQALGLAIEAEEWDDAQVLVQPLAQVYRMQKRHPELDRLRGQLLETIGTTAEAAIEKGSIEFWVYLMGTAGSEATELLDLNRAQALNRELLDYLESQPEAEKDPRTAAVYHQFGVINLHLRRLDEAADWLQRSLNIIEETKDDPAIADDYYALGQVRQHQRLYTEAKDWYKKALDIHQRLPDEEEMVKDYRALGTICHLKFEYQEAQNWYTRAREMVEEARDEETAIQIYHQLATLHHAQYQFDEAQDLYQHALQLSDRLGKREQMAVEFHHLGLLAQARGILYDEAEEWYLTALDTLEELGDRRGVGDECRQLGVLFHEQQRYDDARKWYTQAREIFEEMGDIQRTARTYGQLGMIAEERDNLTEALEWVSRTYQIVVEHNLPVAVQVKAHLARLREKFGEQQFDDWWLNYTGEPAPQDLDVDTSTIL